jgi:protein-L-isoaspartate(D-aspartate) O-methyltransferase
MNLAQARDAMLESQVRTADVTDARILHAMRTLPRERFAPSAKQALAYADLDLDVAPGRSLLRPRDLAKLVQALAPQAHERALEIGGASGYGAALLARLCKEVAALDSEPALSAAARAAFESTGFSNITVVTSPLEGGWQDGAPYDVILLNGACEFVPEVWLKQLAANGRLGAIVRSGGAGAARIYTRAGDSVSYRSVFDAAPPVAPGLHQPATFRF